MRTLKQKVDVELKDARVGWGMEGVKNAYPSSESASKMHTLRQKVDVEALQIWGTKCTCPPSAFLSNRRYRRCSISTRAWAAGWLGAWLVGWLASWLTGAPKCVKNACR